MIEIDSIKRDELIYWIDKSFVQETAKDRIGRELNEEELRKFTKMIEFGLWDPVWQTIRVAIDESVEADSNS